MRTGSEDIAPSSPARWEIDLSAGGASLPERPWAGSKRMFMRAASCSHDGEAEAAHDALGARRGLLAADPQGDHALAVVGRGREHHVADVHAGLAECERDLRYDPGTVRNVHAELVGRAACHPGAEQRVAVGPGPLVP